MAAPARRRELVEREDRQLQAYDLTYLVARVLVTSFMAFMHWWFVSRLPDPFSQNAHFTGVALWTLGTVIAIGAVLVWPRIDLSKALMLALPTDAIALALLTVAVGQYEDPYFALVFAAAAVHATRARWPRPWMGAGILATAYALGHVLAGHTVVEPRAYPFMLAKLALMTAFAWILGSMLASQSERTQALEVETEEVEALNAQLERRVCEMEAVASVSDMLHSTLDVESVGEDVLGVLLDLLGWDAMSMFVVDMTTGATVFSATRGALPRSRPTLAYEVDSIAISGVEEVESFGCIEVLEYHNLAVVLCAANRFIETLDEHDMRVLQAVAAELAVAVENSQLYKLTKRLALTDELTGLYNYRYLQERLDEEVSRARRYNKTLSFLMLDVDDFKRINDTHGHLVGDSVLRELGEVLKSSVREVDVVVRYGGEEFSVVLPETDAAGAFIVAEKIRQSVSMHRFKDEDGEPIIHVTVSIGVANIPVHADDKESLLRAADDAVYYAKESGKDRVRAPRVRLTRFGRPVAAPHSSSESGEDRA